MECWKLKIINLDSKSPKPMSLEPRSLRGRSLVAYSYFGQRGSVFLRRSFDVFTDACNRVFNLPVVTGWLADNDPIRIGACRAAELTVRWQSNPAS